VNLITLVPKHERRLRLVFDDQPDVMALGSSPQTVLYYAVVSQDDRSSVESVTQAIAVAGEPNALELALGSDLAPGGLYLLALNALPSASGGTCTQSTLFRFTVAPTSANLEVPEDDYASLLYGIDLAYSGVDWVETADGDLLTISGLPNAQEAVKRRALADPLPWAPSYGAKTRQYVDSTPGAMPTLKAQLAQNLLLDDRVKAVQAQLSFDPDDPFSAYYDLLVTLIGGETVGPMPIAVSS
jgi:hypothetical protein